VHGIVIQGRLLDNIGTELILHILNGQRIDSVIMSWLELRNMGEYKYYINNGIFTYWERL